MKHASLKAAIVGLGACLLAPAAFADNPGTYTDPNSRTEYGPSDRADQPGSNTGREMQNRNWNNPDIRSQQERRQIGQPDESARGRYQFEDEQDEDLDVETGTDVQDLNPDRM